MRKLLISTAVIALFTLPVSAWAQPDHDHEHGGGGAAPQAQGAPPGGGNHGGGAAPQAQGAPPGGGNHGGGPRPQPGPNPSYSRGPNGGNSGRPAMTSNPGYSRGPNGSTGFNRPATTGNPAYTRGPNGGSQPQNTPNMAGRTGSGGGFNRPGGSGGSRHDFHSFGDYHQNFTAQRHFHAGAYQRPQGWYSHHWVFGETLPPFFWAQNYWLADYVDFGLPPPPYGAVWVRVGDDALLIDQDSGEIITVEYGVFY